MLAPGSVKPATPLLCHTLSMARHIESIEALKGLIGEHLGYSEYMTISQERVNQFAEATGDHQWIHIEKQQSFSDQ